MNLLKLEASMRYEQDQLEAAFAEVQNHQHWKDAIGAWVPVEDLDCVVDAVIHFTGSFAEVVERDVEGGWVRIRAAGYWATMGA